MTIAPKLNPNEIKVLAVLAAASDDFGHYSFKALMRRTRMTRRVVRLACRSLARKGFARFGKGLWTEDGDPAGSGYAATAAGRDRADPRLVDKIVLREWV